MFSWDSLPTSVQIIDIVVWVGGIAYTLAALRAWLTLGATEMLDAERAIAVNAVGTFITINVAAASVLLAGVGVLIGLGFGNEPVPQDVFTELTLAAVLLVISLFCGAVSAAYIVNHVHHSKSVAENFLVMTTSTAQFISTVGGGVFFVTAFFLFDVPQ